MEDLSKQISETILAVATNRGLVKVPAHRKLPGCSSLRIGGNT